MKELELFIAALSLQDQSARSLFLAQHCAENPQLRQELEALLSDYRQAEQMRHSGVTKETNATELFREPNESLEKRDEVGVLLAGKYELLEKLGEGGMGEVWAAKQNEPVKRQVAIKFIRTGMDSRSVLSRFEQERQALAVMDHPNIAKVFDGGLSEHGIPFFVMELVGGLPLNKYCDEAKLSIQDRLELFVCICQAVQHAHQKGVVHRDLKPGNILVTVIDGKPTPKVIDFGVAKAIGGSLTDESMSTQIGAVIGTLEYMAPEQAGVSTNDIDTRADIYSLGVILYELLTGLRPFDSKRLKKAALDEMIRILKEEEPPSLASRLSSDASLPSVAAVRQIEPRRLLSMMKSELDWIAQRCLEKDRKRRYESANGLARDIQRYLEDEPVEARPVSIGYRAGKFLRRNRIAVAAVALVIMVLTGGISGTTVGLIEAQEQTGIAKRKEQEAKMAADAERRANEQTTRRLAQIEKGVDILAGLLMGINPRNEEVRGPTIYEQLAKRVRIAADGLKDDAVGDPVVVARLQTILGGTLMELGDAANAIEVLKKAEATRGRELGADHPLTLNTRNSLASAYWAAGKMSQAVELFELVRDSQVAKLGATAPETLTTIANLAGAYQVTGKRQVAIKLLEQVRDAQTMQLGTDHISTLTTLNNLARAYQADGKLPQAIALFEQVRDARVKKLGANHTSTLNTLASLASAYQLAGKLPQAIKLQEEVRDALVVKLGPNHRDTLVSFHNLAKAYQATGKVAEAIELFVRARDAQIRTLGLEHPHTLLSLKSLALAYQETGKLTLAIEQFERMLNVQVKKFGPDHSDSLTTSTFLAIVHMRDKNYPKAIELLERVRNTEVAKLGVDHPETITTLNNLAFAYRDGGKPSQSIECFEQAAKGIEKLNYQHPNAEKVLPNIIEIYEISGQFKNAEAWRRKWLVVVKERRGANSPEYTNELEFLGINLLRQLREIDAESVLRDALVIREKNEPESWTTFHSCSLLGEALLRQKKYTEAEPQLIKGYEGMKKRINAIPKANNGLYEALDCLIQLYTETNKLDEAKKWQSEKDKLPKPEPAKKG